MVVSRYSVAVRLQEEGGMYSVQYLQSMGSVGSGDGSSAEPTDAHPGFLPSTTYLPLFRPEGGERDGSPYVQYSTTPTGQCLQLPLDNVSNSLPCDPFCPPILLPSFLSSFAMAALFWKWRTISAWSWSWTSVFAPRWVKVLTGRIRILVRGACHGAHTSVGTDRCTDT